MDRKIDKIVKLWYKDGSGKMPKPLPCGLHGKQLMEESDDKELE